MQYRELRRLVKCEKTVRPAMPTADRRYALCLDSPLKSVLSTLTRRKPKTIEPLLNALTIHQMQHVFFCYNVGLIKEIFLFIKVIQSYVYVKITASFRYHSLLVPKYVWDGCRDGCPFSAFPANLHL